LVLLEYRKEDPKVPIRPEHKMSVAEVKTEVEAEGYKLDQVIEKLPRQHIIIFSQGGDSEVNMPDPGLPSPAFASSIVERTSQPQPPPW